MLHASAPTPVGALQAGGKLAGRWYHEGHSDVLKYGSEPGKNYVTLYYLMEIGKKGNLRRDFKHHDPETLGQAWYADSRALLVAKII